MIYRTDEEPYGSNNSTNLNMDYNPNQMRKNTTDLGAISDIYSKPMPSTSNVVQDNNMMNIIPDNNVVQDNNMMNIIPNNNVVQDNNMMNIIPNNNVVQDNNMFNGINSCLDNFDIHEDNDNESDNKLNKIKKYCSENKGKSIGIAIAILIVIILLVILLFSSCSNNKMDNKDSKKSDSVVENDNQTNELANKNKNDLVDNSIEDENVPKASSTAKATSSSKPTASLKPQDGAESNKSVTNTPKNTASTVNNNSNNNNSNTLVNSDKISEQTTQNASQGSNNAQNNDTSQGTGNSQNTSDIKDADTSQNTDSSKNESDSQQTTNNDTPTNTLTPSESNTGSGLSVSISTSQKSYWWTTVTVINVKLTNNTDSTISNWKLQLTLPEEDKKYDVTGVVFKDDLKKKIVNNVVTVTPMGEGFYIKPGETKEFTITVGAKLTDSDISHTISY